MAEENCCLLPSSAWCMRWDSSARVPAHWHRTESGQINTSSTSEHTHINKLTASKWPCLYCYDSNRHIWFGFCKKRHIYFTKDSCPITTIRIQEIYTIFKTVYKQRRGAPRSLASCKEEVFFTSCPVIYTAWKVPSLFFHRWITAIAETSLWHDY